MLTEIRVQDYATIQELEVRFDPGLTVLTGETGAGKSIILGALSLAMGARGSAEMVRTGADGLRVEAVFQPTEELRCELELPPEEELILAREMSSRGRSRAFLGGRQVSVAILAETGRRLVDILGQHHQQDLLDPDRHVDFLDDLAGLGADRIELEELHHREGELAGRLRDRTVRVDRLREQLELAGYQEREIQSLDPQPGELEVLRTRRQLLERAEEIVTAGTETHEELYGADRSLIGRMWGRCHRLQELGGESDPELRELLGEWEGLLYGLEELAGRLLERSRAIPTDPTALEEVRQRIEALAELERRYGSLEAALERGREASDLTRKLEDLEEERSRLEGEHRTMAEELVRRAGGLSRRRREAIPEIQQRMEAELAELGMEKAAFRVALQPVGDGPPAVPKKSWGYERGEFRFSANPGEEPRPLHRVASGGELSRIMLALKTRLSRGGVPVLIFDEVDAGIGGAVAEIVGRKLRLLAEDHQVLCVTHLPQIAALAQQHLRVTKGTHRRRARTAATALDGSGRVAELARMLGGDGAARTAEQHARALLAAGGEPIQ